MSWLITGVKQQPTGATMVLQCPTCKRIEIKHEEQSGGLKPDMFYRINTPCPSCDAGQGFAGIFHKPTWEQPLTAKVQRAAIELHQPVNIKVHVHVEGL